MEKLSAMATDRWLADGKVRLQLVEQVFQRYSAKYPNRPGVFGVVAEDIVRPFAKWQDEDMLLFYADQPDHFREFLVEEGLEKQTRILPMLSDFRDSCSPFRMDDLKGVLVRIIATHPEVDEFYARAIKILDTGLLLRVVDLWWVMVFEEYQRLPIDAVFYEDIVATLYAHLEQNAKTDVQRKAFNKHVLPTKTKKE